MKSLIVIAAAVTAVLPASPGHALALVPVSAEAGDSANLVEQAKWKQKHGQKAKHWNRGNHYGWSRGRGHKYGLRKQGRYY